MYNVRRNILLPSTMCVGIYSHTYKHTTMYTLYYTSKPSHSFCSLSCPVTLGHIRCDFSSVWTQSRSSEKYIHKLKAYLKIFNFIFSQRISIETEQSYWHTRPLRFQHFLLSLHMCFNCKANLGIIQARLFIGI